MGPGITSIRTACEANQFMKDLNMKRAICILLLFCMVPSVFATDIIVTKAKKKYHGKVIKITDNGGYVVRVTDGTVIVLPKTSISKIIRDNTILDFEAGMRYYLEVRRPFLPFAVLGVATGIYSINKFQDYSEHKKLADEQEDEADADWLQESKKDLAWGIVSGLFCIGSFFIALRPLEVKVPMGRINLSTTSKGVILAFHF